VTGWIVVGLLTAGILYLCWVINDDDRTNQVIAGLRHRGRRQ
jgi:hypothetical protein